MPAETGAGVPADASDPGGDPAAAQVTAHPRVVVTLVAVQLARLAPRIAGIKSSNGSTKRLSCRFAAGTSTFSGSPCASTSRWYLLPALPRSVGSAQSAHPPFRPDADRVQAGPRPIQFPLLTEPVEHRLVHLVEHAGIRPLAHPPPAGPPRAVAQLGGQLGPTDPGGQHEGDALEHIAVGDPWA